MEKNELLYDWVDEETAEIYIGGTFVATMSHGPHGWDGMIGIRDTLNSLAKIQGWTVKHKGDPAV